VPFGSVVRQVTASRWATIEWTTLPAGTHTHTHTHTHTISRTHIQNNVVTMLCQAGRRHGLTRLVVEEADGTVLVCGDGDGLQRVADHAVNQLAPWRRGT